MKRNAPCHCGSGLKYKKCHGKPKDLDLFGIYSPPLSRISEGVKRKLLKEKIREASQGQVRPQISVDFKEYKIVAVGNRIHYSKSWKTFHDFLFDYIKTILTAEWGNTELKKPFGERHQLVQWYDSVCAFQKKYIKKDEEIHSAVCTGIVGSFLALAYDLYILRHHSLLQGRLVDRLREPRQFQGVRYEIYVISSFIKAGFEIELENESDKSSTHCEFVATHLKTGRKYSVEAKSRHRPGFLGHPGNPVEDQDQIRLRIGNLINEALKKEAKYTRIIFIDVNMPPSKGATFEKKWFKSLEATLTKIEKNGIAGKLCPPAYTFFTNHPNHYIGVDEVEPSKNFILTALNISTMKENDYQKTIEEEPPIFELWESINRHYRVPSDFE